MNASEARAKAQRVRNRKKREALKAENQKKAELTEGRECGRRNYQEFYGMVVEAIDNAVKSGLNMCSKSLGGGTNQTTPYQYGQVKRTIEVLQKEGFRAEYYESRGRNWSEETTYFCGVKVMW